VCTDEHISILKNVFNIAQDEIEKILRELGHAAEEVGK
jgi:hypothetical protein